MKTTKPKNEKQCALLAWKTATDGEKLTPLLKAIGNALAKSEHKGGTCRYAHELGKFSRLIAGHDGRDDKVTNRQPARKTHACMGHDFYAGKWTVTNHDLSIYSTFQMWMQRYSPADAETSCETVRIATALKNKRMQQAYDRFQKTGLRHEHGKLLSKALWEVDTSRGDWVSLFVQGKRPFGDSSRARSMYQILGWPEPKEDRCLTDAEEERAWNLFDELPFALPEIVAVAMREGW